MPLHRRCKAFCNLWVLLAKVFDIGHGSIDLRSSCFFVSGFNQTDSVLVFYNLPTVDESKLLVGDLINKHQMCTFLNRIGLCDFEAILMIGFLFSCVADTDRVLTRDPTSMM